MFSLAKPTFSNADAITAPSLWGLATCPISLGYAALVMMRASRVSATAGRGKTIAAVAKTNLSNKRAPAHHIVPAAPAYILEG
jgi:hypothetical protein